MSEQRWIIRVQGKEYGPIDLETLQEWKGEGRVIPENEARSIDDVVWTTAAYIPGLFGGSVAAVADRGTGISDPGYKTDRERTGVSDPGYRTQPACSFGQIMSETFRIYRNRFFAFLGLALITILPSVSGQLATGWIETGSSTTFDLRNMIASAFAFCMLVVSIVLWPIYIAGIQVFAAHTLTGNRIGFGPGMNEAVKFWPRVAILCLFVYGVFFLLIMFAVAIALMILTGGSSPLVILFALGLLVLQVWLFGRFFINVLFWQQFAVLENAGVADALRESKMLARSGRELPWYERPLWRGAFIVSIWIAFVLALTVSAQWHSIREYWNYALTIQDPHVLLEKLSAAEQAHTFDFVTLGFGILQKLLQPLLGIAFVVLFFHSKKSDG